MAEPLIALVNTSEEFVQLLRDTLREEGFPHVITRLLSDFKSGREDFSDFLARRDPCLVILDIAIPY